jgi:MFS family permease
MIATILGPISISFDSLSQLSWIATTYLIGMTAVFPVMGHLSDIFGRRNSLLVVNVIFTVGALICGLSPRLWVLLLGRSVSGCGGGAMVSITSIIESDLVPLRNRGITEGLGGVVYGVALAGGGLFGGGINDTLGWKWAFLIQVPIMVTSTVMLWALIKIPRKESNTSSWRRVDYVGGTAIIAAVVFLQLGLASGGNTHSWTSAIVVAGLPVAAFCFTVFIVWDLKFAKEPLIPMHLLRQRNVLCSNVSYFCVLMSYTSIEFYTAIYLQMLGHTPTATGLRFLPQAVGTAAATMGAGFLIKWTGKYYWLNVVSQTFFILGSGLLLTLKTSSPQWPIFVFLAFTGVGFGATWVTVLMGVLSSVTDDQQASVQSAGFCFRTFGMSVGLTVSTAVFQHYLKTGLLFAFRGQAGEDNLVARLRTDFNALQYLKPAQKALGQEAYMRALHVVFWLTTAEILVGGLASLLMTENKLDDSAEN